MKYELKDTTFVFIVRIDSIIRLENLLLALEVLESNINTHIIVAEASYYNNGILEQLLGNKISYFFIEDKDPVFHRTKHQNTILKQVNTDFVGIWEADVILESNQIVESISQLRSGNYDFSFPYDGRCFDTSEILRRHYLLYKNIDFLKKNISKMDLLYSSSNKGNAVGGAFLISTEKYEYSGWDNELFYGWGAEDGERYYRWLVLNYRMFRSQGVLFHLSHPRDQNGMIRSDYHESKIMNEYFKVRNSTKEELINKFHK